ncbi:hypothetical protein JOB18_018224 [Solea senegalensis]|uniref:Uncharacterized protein n=1 Tax=Solea senegalensis TaxID=28829 RepID=A0AAV6PTY4_SOLSE|nr:hypothetical protein JOB18_018224 [Solea senegalensis]
MEMEEEVEEQRQARPQETETETELTKDSGQGSRDGRVEGVCVRKPRIRGLEHLMPGGGGGGPTSRLDPVHRRASLLRRAQKLQFPAFAGMFESRCLVEG